jgi:NDP-sugar pyrophosphorylase family protein
MPIGDMPILEVLIRQMKRHGITDIILTVGHLSHLLQSYFQDGSQYGVNIQYSREDEPLGTAGPLSLIDGLDETFLVTNGDVLTTLNLGELISFHKEEHACATIAMHEREVKIDLGVIRLNGGLEVEDYIEKPRLDYRVSMGIYIFEPKVLEYIPKAKHLDFPDLVLRLISEGERVMGYPYEGYWQDLGRADDYQQAWEDFDEIKVEILGES